MVTGIEPRSRWIRREATTDARQKRSATRSPTKDRGGQEKNIPRSPDCGPESNDNVPPGPTGHHPRPGPGPEGRDLPEPDRAIASPSDRRHVASSHGIMAAHPTRSAPI